MKQRHSFSPRAHHPTPVDRERGENPMEEAGETPQQENVENANEPMMPMPRRVTGKK